MLTRGMRALAPLSVLVLVAGCTGAAESESAPTETVTATATETVTASPEPAPTVTETVTATPEPEETEESAGGDDAVPDYEVTSDSDRTIRVEVESTDGIEAVFDDVIADIDEEGGWFVLVNCSTGGSEAADNRLGNGKYAVGDLGAAQTGLDQGESEFEALPGKECPAN